MSDHSLIIKLGLDTADSKKRVSEINKELKSLDKQIKSLDTSTDDFETNISNMSKKMDLAKTSVVGLSEKLEEQNKQLDKAEKRLEKARKELDEFKNSGEENAKKLKDLENKVTSAQTAFNKLQREVNDTERALESANKSLSDMEKQFKQMPLDNFFKSLDEQIKALDTNTDSFTDNIQNMNKKIDLTKSSVAFLTDYLKKQNEELESSRINFESVKRELEDYQNSVDKTTDGVKQLEQKLTLAESSFNGLQQEINQTEKALESATKEVSDLEKELTEMTFNKLGDNLDNVSEKLGNVASLTAPLSGALVGLGTVSVNSFLDMEGSLVKVKNMLDLTDTEAEKLYDSARDLASKGFGEFDEVLNTLANVKLILGEVLDDSELDSFSKGVLSISQTFDADLNDVLKASQMLITNFGIDGAEALDIIAYGFQNGLNYSDDFLDTLWEYSVQFADMGYSAKEFTSILENGMENGIFNTDKLADAVKEANIRLKEMPEATGEAVKTLGLDVEKIQSDIAKGGDTAQKAMDDVCEAILAIEDPIERNRVGVEIFGTMWEDTGDAIAKSVAGATDDIESLDGSITEMNNNIETMNDGGLAQLKTKMTEAFQVIGEKLCPVFNNLIDAVTDAVDWFTNLDESTQGNIILFGALLTAISPIAGALSTLTGALSSAVGLFGKVSTAINGANGVTTAVSGISTAIGTAGGSTGVIGSLSALASAFAPWLVGGAVVVGVIAGLTILKQQYDEAKEKATLLAEGYEGDVARMKNANALLLEDFNSNYGQAKTDIETFSTEASTLLAQAFSGVGAEGGQTDIDLTAYNTLVAQKLGEVKQTIATHQANMASDLALFNTNYANQQILGWDVINTITENKGAEMEKHVQVAYDNLLNVQKQSALVGQTITDEAGNEMVYTWEMYYDDLEVAQANFEEESLKAQVGFYDEELFNTKTFVNDVGATTYDGYLKQLDDAEQQRDEMIKIAEEQRDEKLKVIQQLSDEELEEMGWTREEAIRIAHLQHEQYVQEAEGMYQDAKAEYTKMAEDTTEITDQQREQTVKNAEEAKQGTVEAIDGLQKEIDEILNQSGQDYEDYGDDAKEGTEKASKSAEQMQTRVVGALDKTEQNFKNTAGVVSRESSSIQSDIDSVQGKTVDVTVNFKTINYADTIAKMQSAQTHVYSAVMGGYKDALIPLNNFGDNYMQDLYGLKDAGIKTISLASLGMDTISAIAGKDGNSIVNNAVANYNYNNSQSVQEIGFKPIKIPQPQETRDKEITVNINIDQMGVGTSREEVRKLMKMIEQEIRIHGKKW